jgi:hypothetical protein
MKGFIASGQPINEPQRASRAMVCVCSSGPGRSGGTRHPPDVITNKRLEISGPLAPAVTFADQHRMYSALTLSSTERHCNRLTRRQAPCLYLSEGV